MKAYIAGALALTVFGFLAGYSLGPGLFLVGVVLLTLTPVRRRAVLFWPPVAASLAWVAGWYASAPLRCIATDSTGGAEPTLSCASLIGVTSSDPAAMMGAAVSFAGAAAVSTFLVVLAVMLVRSRTTAGRPDAMRPDDTDRGVGHEEEPAAGRP